MLMLGGLWQRTCAESALSAQTPAVPFRFQVRGLMWVLVQNEPSPWDRPSALHVCVLGQHSFKKAISD